MLQDDLDIDDKARLRRMASSDLRDRFTRGRVALRSILSTVENNDIPVTAWHFGTTSNGKPYIQAPKNSIVSFNLSYANSFIAIAVSKTVEVGVDIETDHRFPHDELPWHLFSGDEQRLLRTAPQKNFWNVFFRLWTLKEAIAKRTGRGFATEFSEINTLELSVVDRLNKVARLAEAEALLFHTRLTVLDNSLHLAVSTAPIT